jgi:hypothetical protein
MTHSISPRNGVPPDLATAATACRAMAYLNRAVYRPVVRPDVSERPPRVRCLSSTYAAFSCVSIVVGLSGVTFGTCEPSLGPVVFAHMEPTTMRQKILLKQRDLALLGHIGALALVAFGYFSLHHHTRYEVLALHPPSKLDPIAFAWARCNPGAPLPKALKDAPSLLAMS